MKRILALSTFAMYLLTMSGSFTAHAYMMEADGTPQDDHTAREEVEGKEVWQKLQSKAVECQNLSDEDFKHLGEYFMGQMMGDVHPAMNEMMTRMHGEEGENKIHVAMGKRMSGCDPNATIPVYGQGWMPMMNMMGGGWSSPFGNQSNNPMMFGFNNPMVWGFGFFGWLFMLLWWILIIVALIALVRWITRTSGGDGFSRKSALDILKERYARGEIDKKEFEERKKDIIS